MSRPHPRLVGALSILGALAALALAAVRLQPSEAAFDPFEGPPGSVPPWRVDLDRAPASEIAALPGVGPRLADRIVRDRAERGAFGGVRGVDRVPGVGPALVERITPFVR
jgi:competence protein ComEA